MIVDTKKELKVVSNGEDTMESRTRLRTIHVIEKKRNIMMHA